MVLIVFKIHRVGSFGLLLDLGLKFVAFAVVVIRHSFQPYHMTGMAPINVANVGLEVLFSLVGRVQILDNKFASLGIKRSMGMYQGGLLGCEWPKRSDIDKAMPSSLEL